MLEKIIALIADLITAINNNTAALKGAASAPAATGETAAAKKAREKAEKEATAAASAASAGPGVAEVRAAATAYLAAQTDQAKQTAFMSVLNGKYGTKRISEAPAEKFPEIIAVLNDEIARLKSGAIAPASASDAI